jgi:hypothetical protein
MIDHREDLEIIILETQMLLHPIEEMMHQEAIAIVMVLDLVLHQEKELIQIITISINYF